MKRPVSKSMAVVLMPKDLSLYVAKKPRRERRSISASLHMKSRPPWQNLASVTSYDSASPRVRNPIARYDAHRPQAYAHPPVDRNSLKSSIAVSSRGVRTRTVSLSGPTGATTCATAPPTALYRAQTTRNGCPIATISYDLGAKQGGNIYLDVRGLSLIHI